MKKITGTMYSYYFLCPRKMWLFARDLSMEHESEAVAIGKLIDEYSHSRETKHIMIDELANIDFIKDSIVCEIKKSSREKQMAVNQIKYYLYLLKQYDVKAVKGRLSVPKERLSEDVFLSWEDEARIAENLAKIKSIIADEIMPPVLNNKMRTCKACAYFEFCYI